MMGSLATTGLLCGVYATRYSIIAHVFGLEIEGRALKTRGKALNERSEQIIGSIMSMCET